MTKHEQFTGQLMKCVVCNKQLRSHPEVETQWRCVEIDGRRFYACPREFPKDNKGKEAFQQAYQVVIACCMRDIQIETTGVATIDELELYRASRRQKEQKSKGFGGDRDG